MLIEEKIELKMNNMNIKHYRELGFSVKMDDVITITASQLSKGAHNKVHIECDYCGEKFQRTYKDYLKFKGKKVDKDSCSKCRPTKTKENNLANYGVESIRHVKEVNDKIIATNLERYGVSTPFESNKIRNKGISTTLEIYGVDNIFKLEGFHEIQKASMFEKYGYEHYSEDAEKQAEATRKRNETMYKNGNAPSSRQQNYIHDIVGGELNYPVDSLMLDIAFPNERVYIEYQGSGHDLNVLMGKMTKQEFKKKDINRYYYLKKQNWQMIEIISEKDNLPTKEKLVEMISYAKDILTNSSYIVFDIDDKIVKVKGEYFSYDYGDLILDYVFRKHHENGTYGKLIS